MDSLNKFDRFPVTARELPRVVEFYINELVIDGFSSAVADRIAASLQGELSHWVHANDIARLSESPLRIDVLDAGTLRFQSDTRKDQIGSQVAQRIYGQLAHLPATGLTRTAPEGPSHA